MAEPAWIMDLRDALAALGSLSTAVIAGAAAVFAYRQAQTARRRLRFDLFPIRFEVYEVAASNVVKAMNFSDGPVIDGDTIALNRAVRKSRFLFDADTFTYLDALETRILQHRAGVITLKNDGESHRVSQQFLDDFHRNQRLLLLDLTDLAVRLQRFLQVQDDLSFSKAPAQAKLETAAGN